MLDLEDFDAAIAELDARYLAGEAAAYAHTWSVIADGHAALNRHELPPTTPDCVSIDHRRGAAFAPGDLIEYFRAGWELGQDIRTYVEVVHRLSELGAVCTHAGHGVSHEGFDAEWHGVDLLTVEGDMVNRCEAFDDADLDAALAKFDQLSQPAPRLENTASRVNARILACVTARDWDTMASILAEDFYSNDRRRVTGAGTRRGRDAEIENMRVVADLGAKFTVEVIATRGDRLVLTRTRISFDQQQGFLADMLGLVETDLDGRLAAVTLLDLEDFDAAIAELDARYLAGEAAAHAHTWSVVRRRPTPLSTGARLRDDDGLGEYRSSSGAAFAPGDVIAYVRAAGTRGRDINIYIEAVHRLSELGAVVTHVALGSRKRASTPSGGGSTSRRSKATWSAASRFSTRQTSTPRSRGSTSSAGRHRGWKTRQAKWSSASRRTSRPSDWDAMAEILADDFSIDDRRRVVNAGIRHGRDAEIGEHAGDRRTGVHSM